MKRSPIAQKTKTLSLDKLMTRRGSIMNGEWVKSNLSRMVAFLLSDDKPEQAPVARPNVTHSLGHLASPLVDPTGDKDVLARISHALIQFSLEDGDQASTDLAGAMMSMHQQLTQVEKAVDKLCGANQTNNALKAINESIKKTMQDMAEAMVALQFFDRISQRMSHAMAILQIVHGADLEMKTDDVNQRKELLRQLYKHLTMEDERILFNAIQTGKSIQESVDKASAKLQETLKNNDIFLF